MRVEPRRDDDEVGSECAHRGLDDVLERTPVVIVSRPGRQRNVEHTVSARAGAAAAGPEGPLVDRDSQDRRVFREERLRAVSVMDVEVDDCDPLETERGLRVTNGHRDVAEDAKTHGPSAERVVAGRPDEREPSALAATLAASNVVALAKVSRSSHVLAAIPSMKPTYAASWTRSISSRLAARAWT